MEGLQITGVKVSRDAQCAVLETATESGCGIGYWAQVRTFRRYKIKGGQENRLVMLQIEDHEGAEEGEEPQRYTLNGIDIQRAIEAMLRDPEGTQSQGWASHLVMRDELDGPMADAIVQVACFGKVIYG